MVTKKKVQKKTKKMTAEFKKGAAKPSTGKKVTKQKKPATIGYVETKKGY